MNRDLKYLECILLFLYPARTFFNSDFDLFYLGRLRNTNFDFTSGMNMNLNFILQLGKARNLIVNNFGAIP